MATVRKKPPQELLFTDEQLPPVPASSPPPLLSAVPSIGAIEVRDRALRNLRDGELKSVRHPVELASITPLIGKLTFLSRKLWEFLVSYTLSEPHSIHPAGEAALWRVSTTVLKRDSSFTSNDTRYFKASVTELQSTLVAWSSSSRDQNGEIRSWSSTQLLGSVEFVTDSSGRDCVEWSFTPVLLKQLREHRHWFTSELSLVARMRRHSTLALYKLVGRYATLAGGLTPRLPWRTYVPVLTGNADPNVEGIVQKRSSAPPEREKYADWRYFNRDVVSKAVDELNSLQGDFWVQPVTHSRAGARAVELLQFKITHRDGYTKPKPGPSFAVDMSAVAALEAHGIQSKLAQDLCSQYGSDTALKVAAVATSRLADSSLPAIKSVPGFIITELRKSAVSAQPSPTTAAITEDLETVREELTQDLRSHLLRRTKASWADWPEGQKRAYLDQFESDVLPSIPPSVRRLWDPVLPLKNPVISVRFFQWLASSTEPDWLASDATLLLFMHTKSKQPS